MYIIMFVLPVYFYMQMATLEITKIALFFLLQCDFLNMLTLGNILVFES